MKCNNCNTEITLWMSLKQLTPFRFKCSLCKVRYKVSTPRMTFIFVGVIALFVALACGLWLGAGKFGAVFAVPFIALIIGGWLLLEAWMHNYISRLGTFTRIGVTEPADSLDSK